MPIPLWRSVNGITVPVTITSAKQTGVNLGSTTTESDTSFNETSRSEVYVDTSPRLGRKARKRRSELNRLRQSPGQQVSVPELVPILPPAVQDRGKTKFEWTGLHNSVKMQLPFRNRPRSPPRQLPTPLSIPNAVTVSTDASLRSPASGYLSDSSIVVETTWAAEQEAWIIGDEDHKYLEDLPDLGFDVETPLSISRRESRGESMISSTSQANSDNTSKMYHLSIGEHLDREDTLHDMQHNISRPSAHRNSGSIKEDPFVILDQATQEDMDVDDSADELRDVPPVATDTINHELPSYESSDEGWT
ncbi:uncharacterized protein SPPG_00170 [Spizellomyces punctatus DAOM BR117]|uniref:Uncharacterized protein n=1 Tax=Spizellomyces punctatus (strain DAOM BR117) TaxID=645134 RepID=A0A0L0HSV3_SPIPD|nr:uncharacterized protein SPPG_00170 [Spizellomyces punctatus DAOM BR117]KND04441.1 hypothetical protein SPPG_00170 [Spizellomyces punctatus DAOM BR117]|eukprot:XP_016612480.1 hypothetical protein SPPG_00170 [Spizellomyces punctatus DAOM BR117]